jgi:hypothetical protein
MNPGTPSVLFGTILFIGAGALMLRATRAINLHRQCQSWPKVQATILHSTVTVHDDSEGTAYRPQFSFRYSVDGRNYLSTRHTQGMPFLQTEDAALAMLARFPVDSTAEVAIKPGKPDFAVLDTGEPRQWIVIRRVSFAMILVGLGVILKAVLDHS